MKPPAEQEIQRWFKERFPDRHKRSSIVAFIKLCLCGTTDANVGVYHLLSMLDQEESIRRIVNGCGKHLNVIIEIS